MSPLILLFLGVCALGGGALIYAGAAAVYLAGVLLFNLAWLGLKLVLGLGQGVLIALSVAVLFFFKLVWAVAVTGGTVVLALLLVWLVAVLLREKSRSGSREARPTRAGGRVAGAGEWYRADEDRVSELCGRFERYERRLNRMERVLRERWAAGGDR